RGDASSYAERKAALLSVVNQPFVMDHCTHETALDQRSYQELLKLDSPKPLDNAAGWSMETRTGGRPFLCFDEIAVNGSPLIFDPTEFSPGESGIPQSLLEAHFATGKTVNRLWFTHAAANRNPVVVVFTPDGFFNVCGAKAPKLQGAAARFGFIGKPFSADDYLQHLDNLEIEVVDDLEIRIRYDIHSEAGEGCAEVTIFWDAELEHPLLQFSSAHISRLNERLGFAGLNFMRGPTLSGLQNKTGTPEGGIEAFHDGRSVSVLKPDGTSLRNLLVVPVAAGQVVGETLLCETPPKTQLIMDQPQNVSDYFSKTPDPAYQERTDLILTFTSASVTPVTINRAQISLDFNAVNPEANETVNLFFAADMKRLQLCAFTYRLEPVAADFECRLGGHESGAVFISDEAWECSSLAFLPLDDNLAALWLERRPLSERVIRNPHRPSVSANGRFVIFDASEEFNADAAQRIHILDLYRGTVRRVSVDPDGNSWDRSAAFDASGDNFSLITNRSGTAALNIENVKIGLGAGKGEKTGAKYADWCHLHNEIVLADLDDNLKIFNLSNASLSLPLTQRTNLKRAAFSPSGERIAYGAGEHVYLINRDGSEDSLLLENAAYPAWASDSRLLVQRTVNDETDLYLVDIPTGAVTRLTPEDGINVSEPAFVPASEPFVIYVDPGDEICNGHAPCHSTIQAAVNEAESGSENHYTIKITSANYPEALLFSHPGMIALEGAWDRTFTTQQMTENSTIRSLEIVSGVVIVKNIVIH
ncbi:MAG: hypothetical protein U9Q58_06030, partial [Pseudomonadota bacterium]|nr:hypothetical protein [Pseudomonadota bacterium]